MAYQLFHVSDDSGSITQTEITDRPIYREHLTSDDSYILVLYDSIYVWQGAKASIAEKRDAMSLAKKFI